MRSPRCRFSASFLAAAIVLAGSAARAGDGQAPATPQPAAASQPPKPSSSSRLGAQGFGAVGFNFPIATDSFEASALEKRPIEAGGGAQVTNVWRSLFIQGSYNRWSDTGERAFIDSEGNRFGLGIPLSVDATFIDIGAGWRFERTRGPLSALRVVPYAGGGAGVLRYEETSPFALPGENVDEQFTTYHVFVGAEYWVWNWLALAGDVKYRLVRDVLGEGGVSGVLEDDAFDGTSVAFRVLIGPGGPLKRGVTPRRPSVPQRQDPPPLANPPARRPGTPSPERERPRPPSSRLAAVTNAPAPVYIAPDSERTPLRVLQPGTTVQVQRDLGDWLLIQFDDPQWGSRVGYVQKKNVNITSE